MWKHDLSESNPKAWKREQWNIFVANLSGVYCFELDIPLAILKLAKAAVNYAKLSCLPWRLQWNVENLFPVSPLLLL